MSAINLHTTKSAALYFRDSQINKFYDFGGIQLLPNNSYTQKTTIDLDNLYTISILKVADDSVMGSLSYSITEVINVTPSYYWSITPTVDCYNNLIYLKFTYGSINYYTNPFYITSLSEDSVTNFTYKDLASNQYEKIGLKTWFRQKSKQTELTTYYESSTGRTVTQAIKTKSLEMYESEFMSMEDLIMTAKILESPYLFIGSTRYYLFESVKIPELTQQENFGKIKFIISPIYNPSISTDGLVAYYNFDGNSNASIGGVNGTNVNTPTFTTGKIGSAIDFGTDTVQRYCQLADNDIFSFTNGLGTDIPFSVSMWIKISVFSSQNNYLLSKRVNNNLEEEYMMGVSPTGGIFFQKFSDNDSYKIAGVSGGALSLNTWYHIVYVDDGTIPAGGQVFYINGVAQTTSSTIVNAYAGMPNGTSPLRIGQTTVNPSEARRHRGLIDELSFWKNRMLNQSDVTNLYNSGSGITYPF